MNGGNEGEKRNEKSAYNRKKIIQILNEDKVTGFSLMGKCDRQCES